MVGWGGLGYGVVGWGWVEVWSGLGWVCVVWCGMVWCGVLGWCRWCGVVWGVWGGGGWGGGGGDLDLDWGPIFRLSGRLGWSMMASPTILHVGQPCHMMHSLALGGPFPVSSGGGGPRLCRASPCRTGPLPPSSPDLSTPYPPLMEGTPGSTAAPRPARTSLPGGRSPPWRATAPQPTPPWWCGVGWWCGEVGWGGVGWGGLGWRG